VNINLAAVLGLFALLEKLLYLKRDKYLRMLEKEKTKMLSAKSASDKQREHIYFFLSLAFAETQHYRKDFPSPQKYPQHSDFILRIAEGIDQNFVSCYNYPRSRACVTPAAFMLLFVSPILFLTSANSITAGPVD